MIIIKFKKGAYILQLICFASLYSNVSNTNNRNQSLTANLPKEGYQYHIHDKAFPKLY